MPVKKTSKSVTSAKSESDKGVKKSAGVKSSAKSAKGADDKSVKPAKPKTTRKSGAGKSVKPHLVLNNDPKRQVSGYDEILTNNGPIPVAELRKAKTGLTKKEIDLFKKDLLQRRAELLGDVSSLEAETKDHSSGNNSNMADDMADAGNDSFEHESTLGLMEKERKLFKEIEAALVRIDEGIYGVCLETGKPIGKIRLEFKPWARYCIEVARELEKKGLINN
jgi:DnaK suppressor protein